MLIKLDTKGSACPMPIIKLKKCLAQNAMQDVQIMMELTDRGGLKDIPLFCQQQGLLCELVQESPVLEFKIWRQTL
ncbi:MAG: sulfurtransferase TusA family protein [Pseudomonadota bacterium]